jgi:hypothetical protein
MFKAFLPSHFSKAGFLEELEEEEELLEDFFWDVVMKL